ncbi:SOS response-associated peptidase family protein [Psychrobacter sp.]|uniref:SOS response-associated peptidase family protein n=1 Tax=Psychrobacter sp. TaxID=56811 RepID=UPI0025DCDD2A|nr:SOS response-associated peptidase family protein [Psychrobacter sp.]
MCSNFEPASPKQIQQIVDNKQLELDFNYKKRVYPKDFCPILINTEDGLKVVKGQFGLSPKWASDPVDYATYNARLESIEDKKTFRPSFTQNQFCLVPMSAFMEPYYLNSDSDKNLWQRIYQEDNEPFTIAGMYEFNTHFDEPVHSFTLLTHNADDEPFMSQFHKPNKEKRSIYLVEPEKREKYLQATRNQISKLMSLIEGNKFKFEAI